MRVRRLVVVLVLGVVVGLALFQLGALLVVKAYKLPSASMEPTVRRGDRVGVVRFVGSVEPDRGDIVAFRATRRVALLCGQSGVYLKRIVGLPGEQIVEQAGRVFVDGVRLAEPYVGPGHRDAISGSWRVPAGAYFVLGDNRRASCDSRVWGAVPRASLIGEVFLTYWPPGRFGFR